MTRSVPCRSACDRASECGAATVGASALMGLLVFVGCALGVVAALFADHRSAQAAADLAALAGASAVARPGAGTGEPCSVAAATAEANGARLTSCLVEGRGLRVTVEVAGPHWGRWATGDLVAESRAGPAAP